MPDVKLTRRSADYPNVDAVVVGVLAGPDGPQLAPGHGLARRSHMHLTAALAAIGATGKVDDVHSLALVPGLAARRVVLTGLSPAFGRSTSMTEVTLRQGAGSALRHLGPIGAVVLTLPTTTSAYAAAVTEGAALGAYAFRAHKSPKSADSAPVTTTLVLAVADPADAAVKAAVKRAEILSSATTYARDLVNAPPNVLYPETFVEAVRDQVKATKAKVSVVVHDEQDLATMGCGGILGVGQGSVRPPRIVELHYRPARKRVPSVALVGKGITFDTGGVCLKPSAGMLTMKMDMAGAAAVASAVIAAALLKLPVAVTGYLCLAENMPGGGAQRPGDVVTMRNKRTVEIIDTDAEGRMVLGDGLALATERSPDVILDIATLTGACMVALGPRVAGVMSNDDATAAEVLAAAAAAGEPMWQLPLPQDLRAKLDSTTADLQHKGDMYGGALTAALFLSEFVQPATGDPIPWAHLDIAGPAFIDGAPHGYQTKGGTGYGVATLLTFVEGRAVGG